MLKTNTLFELEVLKSEAASHFIRHEYFMIRTGDCRLQADAIRSLNFLLENRLENTLALFFFYQDLF